MNKTVTFALASLLAVTPAAGIAYAQDTMAVPADEMSTGSIAASDVSIIRISSLQNDESKGDQYSRFEAKMNDPATLEQAQADLQSDPALVEALTAQNVQLQNVVEVQTAANGGKIVYVK